MRTARLVGLSADGKSLIVVTDSGEELAIAADDRLRAALRGDRRRLGQVEIEMESALSVREIQTRIRSGEELEDVARVAGIPIDRVERFAAPVLAEREHIAILAMESTIRRRDETSAHRMLRAVVHERLKTRGVDLDTVGWDSHRLPDGRWAVTVTYASGGFERQAEFWFDVSGRYSVAGNDDARSIIGEPPLGGDRAQRSPGEAEAAADGADDTEPTLDLNDELALVRAVSEPPEPSESTEPGPTDASAVPEVAPSGAWEPPIMVDYPVEPTLEEEEAAGSVVETASDEPGRPEEPVAIEDRRDEAQELADDQQSAPAPPAQPPKPVRRKRASVPSWDEIMFGGPKPD